MIKLCPRCAILFVALLLSVSVSEAQTRGSKQKEHAHQLLEQARKLASEWSHAKRTEALKTFNKARLIYQALGDVPNQLAILIETGQIQECSGDASMALANYNRALTLARASRDQRAEATTLNRLGFWHIDRGKHDLAFDYGKQAHQLSLSINDRPIEAEALLLLGTASYHKRHAEAAKEYLTSALAMSSTGTDKKDGPRVLEMLGHVNHELGNTAEALRLFKEALTLAERVNDLKQKGKTLNGIAITLSIIGEKQEAVEYHRQALEIFENIGDRRQQAITLNGLGFIYYAVGENERSVYYYSKALELFTVAGDRDGESIALYRLGKTSEALGNKKAAAQYYEKLRIHSRESKDPVLESYAVNWLGDIVAASNMRAAITYYERALKLTRDNPRNGAYTLNRLGYSHAALGEVEAAQKYYSAALQLAQKINDRESESMTLYNLAVLERGRNALAQAQSYIERSLNLTESLSTAVGDRDLRASYFATVHQHYEFYIDLLMALHQQHPAAGFEAKALEASERSRARALVEMLAEGRADIRKGVDAQLLEQEQLARDKLNKAIEKRSTLLSGRHSPQQVETSNQEILTLTTEHDQILGTIRQKSPQYAALTQPVTLTTRQMQQLLDHDTLMIEYSLGERKSFAWAISKESIDSFELPPRSTLEDLVRTVYEAISNAPDDTTAKSGQGRDEKYTRAIASLSEILLKPLTKHADKKRLAVVADGALQYLPFSVLHTSLPATGPLLDQYEIVNLPSLSALAVLRQTIGERPSAARSLAIIADPVFELGDKRFETSRLSSSSHGPRTRKTPGDGDVSNVGRVLRSIGIGPIERLPFSGREADAVFGMISSPDEGMKAVGFQANRETVLSSGLAQFRVVHFATHGFIDNQYPQLSGLMLSMFDEHGRKQNGFLTLNEIYNLRLSADLVVLSACQTGLGKLIRGEGIVGLTRGFMYAGAPRVVASLWRVDDAATADLMKAFYRALLVDHLKAPDALRAAQRELAKQPRFQHPYYWAGFVIQGEWK